MLALQATCVLAQGKCEGCGLMLPRNDYKTPVRCCKGGRAMGARLHCPRHSAPTFGCRQPVRRSPGQLDPHAGREPMHEEVVHVVQLQRTAHRTHMAGKGDVGMAVAGFL